MLSKTFYPILMIGILHSTTPFTAAGTNVYLGSDSASPHVSIDEVDHEAWSQLVSKYVNQQGMVDYRSWQSSPADRTKLTRYLTDLSMANPQLTSSASSKLAFWINAYNAVTVEGILRVYPTTSIRNHTAKLFGYNIWDDLQLYVGGRAYSLNQIEHELLRKMSEPRIHFAIVCASKGCPRLLNEAYVSDRLNEQLDRNAQHFFRQSQNWSMQGSTARVSPILKWFREDFGGTDAAVIQRISPWLPVPKSDHATTMTRLEYNEYDWTINEQ